MDIVHYYLKLSSHFASEKLNSPIPVTMQELTGIWECTRRNAQLLVRKLREQAYIDWDSGRGRGNLSTLVLKKDREGIRMGRAQELALKGQVVQAFAVLEPSELHAQFTDWLAGQFGAQHSADQKDVLRFPFYRPVLDLDPLHVIRRTEAHLVRQLFNTLVEYHAELESVKPSLAHYWEHNPSWTEWTFYLRKGVWFHHGSRMTAADAVFTFQRILDIEPPDWVTSNFLRLEERGEHVFSITLKEPNALLPHILALERFSIVPKHVRQVSGDRDFRSMPVGTGPFRMVENNEVNMILEAHERYHEGRPLIDRVEIWVWPDYQEHLISGSSIVRESKLQYVDESHSADHAKMITQLEDGSSMLSLNTFKTGPLQDIRIRQAIHMAINRIDMIRTLGGRRQQPASGFHPGNYDDQYGSAVDLDTAAELVQASGYGGETLLLETYEMKSNREDAEWIRACCGAIGLNVEIRIRPIRELTDSESISQADMIFAGEVLGEEPTVELIGMYLSHHGYIRNHLDLKSRFWMDRLVKAALAEPNLQARRTVLERIEEKLRQEYKVLFMYHSRQTVGFDPALNGMTMNAWGKIDYKNVWIKH
ncbi:ABC transporter substrate-binding protein [Paenibacillus chibensis]|uniref:ABC transporter substrate-binding protein n=1 Tax=Paenibacillus chibensis TaxID=59846 RepID=A0ABU6PWP9_9BACL|nr:ABC transporter substrate-binding protein [Paenibacillus chibensis]